MLNKYIDDDEGSVESEDIDIHEIVRTHNLAEVKQAIARDRPRLIALKDEVSPFILLFTKLKVILFAVCALQNGRIPLHHAVQLDRQRIALFLIAKRSDVNARDNEEQTPLHIAAMEGLTEMCRFLLDFQANIKSKDTNCWTALHHAVKGNHMETATLLIKRGAMLNAEDHKFGRTPLHLAAELGLTKMAEMLILRGADLCATGDAFFSKTPLHLSCIHGHSDTVKLLCMRGADVNMLSGLLDKSPLHFACEKGHTECVRLLIQHGARINACGQTVYPASLETVLFVLC
jgi:ankyrin repeat protein